MSKSRTGILLTLFICASMTALCFAGCGSGGTASLADPLAVYQQAREKVQTADSFHMRGEMVMEFSDFPGAETMAVDYDMAYESNSEGEMLAKMDMRYRGQQGFDVQAYILEDRMYMQMPGGMWVYQDLDLASDLTNVGQAMGPQYVMQMLDMAESAEVVAEDAASITYDLVLDFDEMIAAQEQEIQEMLQKLEEEGVPEFDADQFMELMRAILSRLDLQMTVDKDSGLATAFKMYLELDLSLFAELFAESTLPQGASMTMDADFEIDDYGKTFNIQLPEEAEGAIPIEELEELSET